jgi:hypothetical protein
MLHAKVPTTVTVAPVVDDGDGITAMLTYTTDGTAHVVPLTSDLLRDLHRQVVITRNDIVGTAYAAHVAQAARRLA